MFEAFAPVDHGLAGGEEWVCKGGGSGVVVALGEAEVEDEALEFVGGGDAFESGGEFFVDIVDDLVEAEVGVGTFKDAGGREWSWVGRRLRCW